MIFGSTPKSRFLSNTLKDLLRCVDEIGEKGEDYVGEDEFMAIDLIRRVRGMN